VFKKYLTFIFCILLQISSIQARRIKLEEANTEIVKNRISVKINKDGTATLTEERQLKILNESGRFDHVTHQIEFYPDLMNVVVLEAKTISLAEQREFSVDRKDIESKPLASSKMGFSEVNQITIPFQNVTVGSILHLKTETHLIKPQFLNVFKSCIEFKEYVSYRHLEVDVTSELPLDIHLNDPFNIIGAESKVTDGLSVFKFRLTTPTIEGLVHELDTFLEPQKRTFILIASQGCQTVIEKVNTEKCEKIVDGLLPKELKEMANIAKNFEHEQDQITSVMSGIQKAITYLGYWKGDGFSVPRTLEEIVNSGQGDCKDYSACLIAVMRALQYEAYFASVFSNKNPKANKNKWETNHAIVKLIGKSGRVYWLDPTNPIVMADSISSDIADRSVIVHHTTKPTFEKIPPIRYLHARTEHERTITFVDKDVSITKGLLKLFGESAEDFLQKSYGITDPSVISEPLLNEISHSGQPHNATFNSNMDGCGILKDIEIDYEFEENIESFFIPTNFGLSILLSSSKGENYINTKTTNEGALFVGMPESFTNRTLYKGLKAERLECLAFSINTPWLEANRVLKQTPDGVEVSETFNVIQSIITPEEIRLPEFDDLKQTLKKFHKMAIIVEFIED